MEINKENITDWLKSLQDNICKALELEDGLAKFKEENWTRKEGGGGRSRVIENGNVIEKGGVMFSAVSGKIPAFLLKEHEHSITSSSFGSIEEELFFATGISIVIHPQSPLVPIIHMNIRYFEMLGESGKEMRWFGGGIDLSPHFVIEDDARFFHRSLKHTCDKFHSDFYFKFKNWADDYFFIKHRQETRGIGGIFYDRLNPQSTGLEWVDIFEFSKAVGRTFLPVYIELINRNKEKLVKEDEKLWQYQRRSRYAEFNLVYDSGTKFGLDTNGRIESILMSLPPQANWVYNFNAKPGSEEEKTLGLLKKGINWI